MSQFSKNNSKKWQPHTERSINEVDHLNSQFSFNKNEKNENQKDDGKMINDKMTKGE